MGLRSKGPRGLFLYILLLSTLGSCALLKKKQLEHRQSKQENKVFIKEKEIYSPAIANTFEIPLTLISSKQGEGLSFKLGLEKTQIKANLKDEILKLSIERQEEKTTSIQKENTRVLAKENISQKEKIMYRLPSWVWILLLFNGVYLIWKLRKLTFLGNEFFYKS